MRKLTTSILALFALSSAALAQDARLTVVHGVPGLPRAVDVFADGNQLFSFCFEEQRGPLLLPAGTYDVEVRLAGATVLAQTYTLAAGDDVSVAAHLDAVGTPLLSAFVNDGSALALPASRVAVRHTAAAPAVDVAFFVGGSEVLTIPALANGQQAAADVPPGTYDVALRVAGTSTVAFGPVPVTVEDGYRYGVFAVGEVGTPSFDLVVQRDALAAFVRSMEGLQFAGIDPHLVLDGTEVLPLDSLVEGPVAVQPGTYTAEVRIQNGQAALVTQSITLARGEDRTLLPHLGFGTLFRFGSFSNSTAPLALASNARVTVRHLALAPTVDVIVTQGGAPVATIAGLSNGDEAVAELPAGTYEVAIAPAGTTTPVFGPVALNFAARTNTIAQALGSLGSSFTVGVDTIDLAGVTQPSEVLVRNEGTSCGPMLSASAQCLFFEQAFDVRVAGGPSDSAALLVWGTGPGASALPLPLDGTNFGAPGCFLYVEPRAFELLALDGSGSGARSFRVPAAVAGFAQPLYAQAIVASTNALHLATSDALVIEPN
jgi:hypothetical protein